MVFHESSSSFHMILFRYFKTALPVHSGSNGPSSTGSLLTCKVSKHNRLRFNLLGDSKTVANILKDMHNLFFYIFPCLFYSRKGRTESIMLTCQFTEYTDIK